MTTPTPPAPTPAPAPTPPPSPAGQRVVAWIDQSQGGLNASQLGTIVALLNATALDVAAAWGPSAMSLHVVATLATVPAGADKAYFLPTADVADALGYHDTDPAGDPYIRVFVTTILSNGGSVLSGSNSVIVCADHEAKELAVDPSCTLTAVDAQGRTWAKESCDPVESTTYNVTVNGASLPASDFVTPAFFDVKGTAPFDHAGVLSAPFTLAPGGYAVVNDSQIFADGYPMWRQDMKVHTGAEASRTYKRLHPEAARFSR